MLPDEEVEALCTELEAEKAAARRRRSRAAAVSLYWRRDVS